MNIVINNSESTGSALRFGETAVVGRAIALSTCAVTAMLVTPFISGGSLLADFNAEDFSAEDFLA